jgi:hypothetical protein
MIDYSSALTYCQARPQAIHALAMQLSVSSVDCEPRDQKQI